MALCFRRATFGLRQFQQFVLNGNDGLAVVEDSALPTSGILRA